MGFFDEYKEPTGGTFVAAEEKNVLIDNGIPMQITGIYEEEGTGQYKPRFVAQVLLPNPETGTEEERRIGFPKDSVESRDRMLNQMAAYLDRDDAEPVTVKLEKSGRSILVRSA